MNCPRCPSSILDERERNGVTVDVCPACRGVWLDRGELERMLSYVQREVANERTQYGYEREPPSSDRRGHSHDRPPSYHSSRQYDPEYGHRKKKSWLENLGDIFD